VKAHEKNHYRNETAIAAALKLSQKHFRPLIALKLFVCLFYDSTIGLKNYDDRATPMVIRHV
jgi:hypothetical protein